VQLNSFFEIGLSKKKTYYLILSPNVFNWCTKWFYLFIFIFFYFYINTTVVLVSHYSVVQWNIILQSLDIHVHVYAYEKITKMEIIVIIQQGISM